MSSKSATFIVIFIVAIVAFCLASVFAAMTGPISILPNGTDSDDASNLSVDDSGNDYQYDDSQYYYDNSYVETTTEPAPQTDGGENSSSGGNSIDSLKDIQI